MKKLKLSYIEHDGEIYLHGENLLDELIEYNSMFADDAGFTKETLIYLVNWILREIESDNATV